MKPYYLLHLMPYYNSNSFSIPFLKSLSFLLFYAAAFCSSSSSQTPTLVLPLKTQIIPTGSIPRPPNKLPFHHNVSLTVSLTVGTPPQNVSMVIDTGSELSWLHCNKTPNFPTTFDPARSTSYSLISCSSPTCTTQTQDFPIPTSCDKTLTNPAIVSKSRTCALLIPVTQSVVDPLSPSALPIPIIPRAHRHFLFLLLLFPFVWILDFGFLIMDYGFWISLRGLWILMLN